LSDKEEMLLIFRSTRRQKDQIPVLSQRRHTTVTETIVLTRKHSNIRYTD